MQVLSILAEVSDHMRKAKWLTLLPHNLPDPVEESSVFGVGGGLVMNELHLRETETKELAPRVPRQGTFGPWLAGPEPTKVRPGLEVQLFTCKQGHPRPLWDLKPRK